MEYKVKNLPTLSLFYNGKWIIYCIFLTTLLQAYFGYARDAHPIFKLLIAIFCWIPVVYCIKQINIINLYPIGTRIIIKMLMACISISFIHAIIEGQVFSGNKYVVLLTNMYSTLDIVGIFFITAIVKIRDLKCLLNITKLYILFSVILLIVNYQTSIESYFLSYTLIYASIFIPYINSKNKLIILSGFALSLFAFWGGGRQTALLLFFAILALCAGYWLSKKIVLIVSLSIALTPLLLLFYSINNNNSIFNLLSEKVTSQENFKGEKINSDSRTFLYIEFYDDFKKQSKPTQIFGKGTLGHYQSEWFETSNRFGIEIPMLQWIIQAGILYGILFTLLIFSSIIYLFKKGKNKMSKIASILIASFYLNCYVSNLIGCNIAYIGFWFLIAISSGMKLMEYPDYKISYLLSKPKNQSRKS